MMFSRSYKEYEDAPFIKLNDEFDGKSNSYFDIIKRRKSVRKYLDTPLTLDQLSYLLWASTGSNEERNSVGFKFRTSPSAGALYPIETYVFINYGSVSISPGLYHYNIKKHGLELLGGDKSIEILEKSALGQKMVSQSAATFIWTSVYQRIEQKYGSRGHRYVFIEAGHISSQLYLAAIDLGLDTCQIGAFHDPIVNDFLGVDGKKESVVYMSVIGVEGN